MDDRDDRFVDLVWLLHMSHDEYLDRFRGTAIRRAKHWMLQRNAAVALGNTGGYDALPHLVRALETNDHPIVRGHAAWAIGRLGSRLGLPECGPALRCSLASEQDDTVRQEIADALADLGLET